MQLISASTGRSQAALRQFLPPPGTAAEWPVGQQRPAARAGGCGRATSRGRGVVCRDCCGQQGDRHRRPRGRRGQIPLSTHLAPVWTAPTPARPGTGQLRSRVCSGYTRPACGPPVRSPGQAGLGVDRTVLLGGDEVKSADVDRGDEDPVPEPCRAESVGRRSRRSCRGRLTRASLPLAALSGAALKWEDSRRRPIGSV
jgi:hypothetical protein